MSVDYNNLTKQQAYEHIRHYFTRPGARLSRGLDRCYYRHPDDGRACAVGCLIPDELYNPDMEGRSAHSVLTRDLGWDDDLAVFLGAAQRKHDSANDVADFLLRLDALADEQTDLTVIA